MPGRDLSSELFADQPAKGGRNLSTELSFEQVPTRNLSDIPLEALKNIPSSAANFFGGLAQAVAHPIQTAGTVLDIGAGALRNALPTPVVNAINRLEFNPQAGERASNVSDLAAQALKNRYGSVEALKNTIATDPVGAAADISGILYGGASLAGKVPALANAAAPLRTAATVANPLTLPIMAASKAAPVIGNTAASLIGNLGTHTGAETIKQAFRSGREGGESANQFLGNLRGNVPITDVLDSAKANLDALGQAKSQAYREGIAQVSNDKTILDFSGIDKALDDAFKLSTFKGQVKNTKAAQVQQQISDVVNKWKNLDPAEYHTPEGLDALKQRIGGIVESIPFEEKTANKVGSGIYNAVKQEIVKQAPTYADTMKAYSDASDQIREIERALSLGKNASVDTAIRKLQSLTRNNVNTNYGNRLALAKELEQQGGNQIMPALAGQALSTVTPRGLGGAVAGGLGLGSFALGGPGLAIPALALQSPRLVGEAAYGLGSAFRAGDKAANALRTRFGDQIQEIPSALPDNSLKLAPLGPYESPLLSPEYKFPQNIDLWSFAEGPSSKNSGVPDTQRLATAHDYPTIDFPLRQEVLQQPEIANAINQFRMQSVELSKKASNAISPSVRNKAERDLAALQQEFAQGMRQLGISNAAEAHGLNRPLYETGVQSRLPIQQTFNPRNYQP